MALCGCHTQRLHQQLCFSNCALQCRSCLLEHFPASAVAPGFSSPGSKTRVPDVFRQNRVASGIEAQSIDFCTGCDLNVTKGALHVSHVQAPGFEECLPVCLYTCARAALGRPRRGSATCRRQSETASHFSHLCDCLQV